MNFNTAPAVFQFEAHPLRTILKGEDPWFVAVDACRALGLKNSRDAIRVLDADEKGVGLIYTPGGEQRVAIINESGLYTLILRCRDAVTPGTVPHKFRKWVTSEVLPAIRKRDAYFDEGTRNSIEGLCCHMAFLHSWWKRVYPGLKALNPHLASGAYDRFGDGAMFAHGLVAKLGLKSWHKYAAGYPWDGSFTDRDLYRRHMERIAA